MLTFVTRRSRVMALRLTKWLGTFTCIIPIRPLPLSTYLSIVELNLFACRVLLTATTCPNPVVTLRRSVLLSGP